MALTVDYKEGVLKDIRENPEVAREYYREAMKAIVNGENEVANTTSAIWSTQASGSSVSPRRRASVRRTFTGPSPSAAIRPCAHSARSPRPSARSLAFKRPWRCFREECGSPMLVDQFTFRRQLRQFRILTVVGYVMLLLVVVGMVVAGSALEGMVQSIPVAVPVGLVGLVLVFSVVMPFLLAAYDKTTCPHCGKRIEDGYWVWHGIRFKGPTSRYWKLFLTLRICIHMSNWLLFRF